MITMVSILIFETGKKKKPKVLDQKYMGLMNDTYFLRCGEENL